MILLESVRLVAMQSGAVNYYRSTAYISVILIWQGFYRKITIVIAERIRKSPLFYTIPVSKASKLSRRFTCGTGFAIVVKMPFTPNILSTNMSKEKQLNWLAVSVDVLIFISFSLHLCYNFADTLRES